VVIPTPVLPGRPWEWLVVDERPYEVVMDPDLTWIQSASGIHRMMVRDLEAFSGNRLRGGDGRVTAPIPGLIARLFVQPGMMVTVGQPLLVLEAMKMENEIGAPVAGQVLAVHVQPGQTVARKHLLVEIG
jgi:biotin carboxyl carrier protein